MYRFETNWVALRDERLSRVREAQAGDSEAMDRLRTMALHAGVFAALSIHSPVWRQEEMYADWLVGKPIRSLPLHVTAAERVGAWIATTMTLDMLADPTGVTFAKAVSEMDGFGPTKAHFFAACMGYDDVPTIDVHMTRLLQRQGIMKQKFAPRGWKQYRALVAASGWTTLDQWRNFLAVPRQFATKPAFADSHHDVLFASLLGAKAVTAPSPL